MWPSRGDQARVEDMLLSGTGPLAEARPWSCRPRGTREPLDSVRYLGNRSSGRMGVALAEEAGRRNAAVTLLAANLSVPAPPGVTLVETPTAADLEREALERSDADVVVMAAAVADYRPVAPLEDKRPKDGAEWEISLEPTTDVLAAIGAQRRNGQVLVGFAADHGEAGLERARRKRVAKNADLFVFNDVSRADIGFDALENEVVVVSADSERAIAKAPKPLVAAAVLGRSGAATLGDMTDAARAERPVAARSAAEVVERVVENLERAVRAPRTTLQLCVLCLIAEGHLIIEDFPGVGKTVLAKSIARSLDLSFSRLQFTPDLLPTDVTGVNVFNQRSGEFEFRSGPVFANVLLVDEINRASPKTQSALLEAMQEAQVTIDGATYALEQPFFVVATQNPIEYEGTYPLPEAQLDRFTARLSLGYPPHGEEAKMLAEQTTNPPLDRLSPVASRDDLLAAIEAAQAVFIEEGVGDYVVTLLRHTRKALLALGASPRAGIALLRMAKARAAAASAATTSSEDVRGIARVVLSHRVIVAPEARATGARGEDAIDRALADTLVPR